MEIIDGLFFFRENFEFVDLVDNLILCTLCEDEGVEKYYNGDVGFRIHTSKAHTN